MNVINVIDLEGFFFLLRISFIPSMINLLLNIGCNVSGYLSTQYKMACFPNLLGILRYRFVTSNVTMSVSGLIFCGVEF